MKILFVLPACSKNQKQAWINASFKLNWIKLFFLFYHESRVPSCYTEKHSLSLPERGGLYNYRVIKKFIQDNHIQAIISFNPSSFVLTGLIAKSCKINHITKLLSPSDIPRGFYFWLPFIWLNDGILAVNNQTKWQLIRKPFIQPKQIKVVHSPILNLPTLPAPKNTSDSTFHLTAIRNLSRRGGLNLLLEAIALLPSHLQQKIHLNIAGSGRGEQKLRHMVQELKLKQAVTFLPIPKDPTSLLDQTNLYVDLSQMYYRKNTHFVIAMARGIPVLCANKGFINEIIDERHVGFSTPLHPQAITNQLVTILKTESLKKMGSQASKVAQRLFSLEGTLNETREFIFTLNSPTQQRALEWKVPENPRSA